VSFTEDELERYARHIVLREIGGVGQQKLKAAHVSCIGAGGLGSPALLYLAAAGIGRLTLIDDDHVSLSNLQRQVLHSTHDVDRNKGDSAAETLEAINPHVELILQNQRLDENNSEQLLRGADIVLDGSDSCATRIAVNRAAIALGIPLVSGAITQWEGQVSVFEAVENTPCYNCIFPKQPADGLAPSCAEAGVMGALAGTIGSMMATEAIKIITGAGDPLRGRMFLFDALYADARIVAIKPDPACPVCRERRA
jgi:molybdopterin/thiamine biosynthesis adenylyltransferase